ncbi:EmrB/QacA subfamily drug resistance transporter [Actinomadura hallensis]|uniref:EmrB/QacA subfamily drug resistance transporter n=1 Tax=Actinomadura hallensis TaxID=337895 RepID=A0A543IFQ0_9ACTN|nr:DHA2 family efflux MFS transporter permease subunit [Actinomadura hallensis]TQM69413.1 EmrB/QacA subfamily drug resistance transporter [Actinomadura hallensis]HLV74754.1 DHA2 family efflux MFS transporter permease subunit [Vulgatibacteraceae bacterium]
MTEAAGVRDWDRRRRWQALSVCLVAAFMTLLDVSIVNVALPSIREGLNASEAGLQWILSGYALTFGLVLVPAGRLGDARSRRAVFMSGLALFTASSALAGLAPTVAFLVVARLVQGAAGGILTPQVAGLIQELFGGAARGRAFGALGAVIGVATAVGPMVGGALIALAGPEQGWRWVFYVNIPVGAVALVLAWRLLPAPAYGERQGLDPLGVLLLGAGVVCVLLPLVQEQQWESDLKWLLVLAGLALIAVFAAWERRARSPMVRLALFRFRSYALGTAIALLYFAGFTAIFFILTLYLQSGLGYSALGAGFAMTPFAVGSGLGSAAGGRIVARAGRALVVAGLLLVLAGVGAVWLAVHLHPGGGVAWAIAGPLLVAGTGSGLVIAPNQTLTLSEVPPAEGGSAAGVLQTGQRVGSAVGIAAVGYVFFAFLSGSGGDWAAAFRHGLVVILGLVAAALAAALADLAADRRARRRAGSRAGRA